MADGRTLKITINVDSGTAIGEIQKIQDKLKDLAASASASGGFKWSSSGPGGVGGVGKAARDATKDVLALRKALKSVEKAGGPDAAAAGAYRKMLKTSAFPAGQKNTDLINQAQALVKRNLDTVTKAGLRGTSADSLVAAQRMRFQKLGADVTSYAKGVRGLVKLTGGVASDETKVAFDKAEGYAKASSKNVLDQWNLLQKKRDELSRRKSGDLSVRTTEKDVQDQAKAFSDAVRADKEAQKSMRVSGDAMYASARRNVTETRTLASSIETVRKAADASRSSLKTMGEGISRSVAAVKQNVSDIGGSPTNSAKTAFNNAVSQANSALKTYQDARQKVFDTRELVLSGKKSAADLTDALSSARTAGANLRGALVNLGTSATAYEQSAVKSAAATYKLESGLASIGKTVATAKSNLTAWGDQAQAQVQRVNRYVAAKGVNADKSSRLEFGIAGSSYDKSLRDYKTAVDDAAKIKEKFLKNGATGAEVKAAFDRVSGAARGVRAAYKDLASAGDGVIRSSRELAKTLSHNQEQLDKARRSAYAWSIAGYQLQATLGIVTKTMTDSVKSFSDFDFTVRRAAGALGIFDQTSASFNELGAAIEQTAIATKLFDPQTIAQGMYYWGSTTGQVVDETNDLVAIQKQVIPIMQMAAITQTDLQSALKGVYSVMQQYAMPMEAAQGVTEKLFLVTQKTAAEFPDLLDSFKMVGPIANEIGVSFDDVVGMLGALSNAGIKGGMAGRALRQTFIKLTDPTVRASKALDEATAAAYGLGTSFDDIVFPEGKFIGMQQYLDVLSTITKDLTEQERNRLLGIITTNNELPALTKLISANTAAMVANKAGVVDEARSMYSSAEAAKSFGGAVENQMQSAQAVMSEFGNVVQSVAIETGKNIWEMVRPFVQAAIGIGKFFLAAIQSSPVMAQLSAAVLLVSGVMVALGSSALIAAGSMKLLHAVMAFDLIPNLFKTAVASGSAAGALATLTAALNAAMLASGRGAIGTLARIALGGLRSAIVGVVRIIPMLISGFASATKAIAVFLATDPIGWALLLAGAFVWAINNIKWLGQAVEQFNDTFGKFIENVTSGAMKLVSDAIDWIGGKVTRVGDGFYGWLAQIVRANTELKDFGKTVAGMPGASGSGDKPAWQKNYANHTYAPDEASGTSAFSREQQQQFYSDSQLMRQQMSGVMSKMAEDVALSYQSDLQKAITNANKTALDRAAEAIDLRKLLSRTFRTGKADDAKAAIDRADAYLKSLTNRFSEKMAPAMDAVASGITNLLNSKSDFANKLGTALSGAVEKGFLTGDSAAVSASVQRFLKNVGDKIESGKSALRVSGGTAFAEFLDGFSNYDFSGNEGAKTLLESAILQLTTPGAQAAGMAAGIEFLKMMGLVVTKNMPTVAVGDRGRRNVQTLDINLPTVPKDTKTGGSNQQTPLEKALDVARQAAELAENLQKVAGRDIKAMVKSAMGKIAEAVVLADKITYETTKSFSKAKLKAVAEFSENSAKVMTLISTALDAFDKMTRFKKVPVKSFTDLKTNIIDAIRSIEGAAKSFTDAKLLATTIVFSESVEKVMSAIGAALDVFAKMPETFTRTPRKQWDNITADIAAAVDSLGKASKKVREDVVAAAKNFAEDTNGAIAEISAAIDLFAKVGDLGTYKRQPKTLWTELTADIAAAVDALGRAATTVKGPLVTAAQKFADSIKSALEVMGNAVDLFDKMPMAIDLPDGSIFTPIADRIGMMATALGSAAGQVDSNLLNAAKAFASKVGPVVEVIGGAVEALNGVAAFVVPDPGQISNVVASIRRVMDAMALEADPKKFNSKVATAITNFSKAAVDALNAVKTANDVFAPTVQDIVDKYAQVEVQPPDVARSVKWIVDTMNAIKVEAVKFPKGITDAVSRMAIAAGQVIETVKSFFEIIAAQDLSQAGQTEMVKNISESIRIAIATIKAALEPFVGGFKVTGQDIVTNLVTGINDKLPSLRKAVDDLKALLQEALTAQAGLAAATVLPAGATAVAGSAAAYTGRTKKQIQADIDTENKWLSWYATVKSPTQHQKDLAAAHRDRLKQFQAEYAAAPYAKGGLFKAGQLMLVGEKGPELMVPSTDGRIIPNNQIGSVVGTPSTIVVEHVVKGDVSSMTATQIAAMLNSSMGSLATAISTSSKR